MFLVLVLCIFVSVLCAVLVLFSDKLAGATFSKMTYLMSSWIVNLNAVTNTSQRLIRKHSFPHNIKYVLCIRNSHLVHCSLAADCWKFCAC